MQQHQKKMQRHEKNTQKRNNNIQKEKISRNKESVASLIMLLDNITSVIQYDVQVHVYSTMKCNPNTYFIDFRKYNINVNVHSKHM